MTLLARNTDITNAAQIGGSQLPDPRVSTNRILEYSQVSDDELVTAARGSDERAFAELCRRHGDSIQRRIFRMLRNREDTEDVLQDAIYRAFVHLQCFRGTSSFSAWLTRIAINSALMLIRKRKSRCEFSYDRRTDEEQESQIWEFPDHSPNPEQIYVKRLAIERMSVAVNRLSPRYRDLVLQFYGTEESLQETADKLGIKLGTAKARLLRARLKIRSRLEKQRISFADVCH